jgi:hypothetical protein
MVRPHAPAYPPSQQSAVLDNHSSVRTTYQVCSLIGMDGLKGLGSAGINLKSSSRYQATVRSMASQWRLRVKSWPFSAVSPRGASLKISGPFALFRNIRPYSRALGELFLCSHGARAFAYRPTVYSIDAASCWNSRRATQSFLRVRPASTTAASRSDRLVSSDGSCRSGTSS